MVIGLVALFLYVVIGALVPSIVKLSLPEIPPITLTFLRFLIASVILFPIYWRQRPNKMTQSQIIKLLSIGSLGTAFNVGLYAYAIQFTSVITSQVLYATVPIVVAILGFFLIRERITKYQMMGAIVGFMGVLFLFYQSVLSQDIRTLGTPFGNMMIFIGVFTWSLYTILSRDLSKKYSPVTIIFLGFIAAVVILGFFVPIELGAKNISLQAVSTEAWLSVIFLGISAVVIYFLYQFGLKKTSAFIASLTLYLSLIAVPLPAIILLHERITPLLLIGTILILAGTFLAVTYQQLRKHPKPVLQ